MSRALRIGLAVLAGLTLVGAVVVTSALYPWVRDDVLLDRAVQAVALDWRDFGEDAALARLQYELDHQGIGMQVADHDCALSEAPDGTREVRCAWAVAVTVPGTEATYPLHFDSRAVVTPDGDLQ